MCVRLHRYCTAMPEDSIFCTTIHVRVVQKMLEQWLALR